jgi:4-hydroxyphenylacetate decarboxylase large subunit
MEVDDPPKKNGNTLGLSFKYGVTPSDEVGYREIEKEPSPRVKDIRDLYFETKSSISIEFPYWYSRRWFELEGEVQIVRRAEALKSAFSHLTPVIFPDELLVMGKTHYLRGSYPMPWLSESFFMSVEDEMYQEALNSPTCGRTSR